MLSEKANRPNIKVKCICLELNLVSLLPQRIQQTESELRGLQRTCRDLIVRTAVCVGAASRTAPGATPTATVLDRVNGVARPTVAARASPDPLSRSHRSSNG